jgi:hypothetical protein
MKSTIDVYKIVFPLIDSIFEKNLGPLELVTLGAKSSHALWLLGYQDFVGAERLQRMVISGLEKLGNKFIQNREVSYALHLLGYILRVKGDFLGAKKAFLKSLHLSRLARGKLFPAQRDIFSMKFLILMQAKIEIIEVVALLHEVLGKCIKYKHCGRYDRHTVIVLELLNHLLNTQGNLHEAQMLRSQYPDVF